MYRGSHHHHGMYHSSPRPYAHQGYPTTKAEDNMIEVVQQFREFKPYLKKRLAYIRQSGRALELQDEVENIEFYLEVMKDILADESHGVDQLRSFIDKIHEMIRKNPLTDLPVSKRHSQDGRDEYDDNDRPRSPSPERRGSESSANIPLIPTHGAHHTVEVNFGSRNEHHKHQKYDETPDEWGHSPFEGSYSRRDPYKDVDMRSSSYYSSSGSMGRGQRRWSEEDNFNGGARASGRGLGRGAPVPHSHRNDDYRQDHDSRGGRGRGFNDNEYERRNDFYRLDRERERDFSKPEWFTGGGGGPSNGSNKFDEWQTKSESRDHSYRPDMDRRHRDEDRRKSHSENRERDEKYHHAQHIAKFFERRPSGDSRNREERSDDYGGGSSSYDRRSRSDRAHDSSSRHDMNSPHSDFSHGRRSSHGDFHGRRSEDDRSRMDGSFLPPSTAPPLLNPMTSIPINPQAQSVGYGQPQPAPLYTNPGLLGPPPGTFSNQNPGLLPLPIPNAGTVGMGLGMPNVAASVALGFQQTQAPPQTTLFPMQDIHANSSGYRVPPVPLPRAPVPPSPARNPTHPSPDHYQGGPVPSGSPSYASPSEPSAEQMREITMMKAKQCFGRVVSRTPSSTHSPSTITSPGPTSPNSLSSDNQSSSNLDPRLNRSRPSSVHHSSVQSRQMSPPGSSAEPSSDSRASRPDAGNVLRVSSSDARVRSRIEQERKRAQDSRDRDRFRGSESSSKSYSSSNNKKGSKMQELRKQLEKEGFHRLGRPPPKKPSGSFEDAITATRDDEADISSPKSGDKSKSPTRSSSSHSKERESDSGRQSRSHTEKTDRGRSPRRRGSDKDRSGGKSKETTSAKSSTAPEKKNNNKDAEDRGRSPRSPRRRVTQGDTNDKSKEKNAPAQSSKSARSSDSSGGAAVPKPPIDPTKPPAFKIPRKPKPPPKEPEVVVQTSEETTEKDVCTSPPASPEPALSQVPDSESRSESAEDPQPSSSSAAKPPAKKSSASSSKARSSDVDPNALEFLKKFLITSASSPEEREYYLQNEDNLKDIFFKIKSEISAAKGKSGEDSEKTQDSATANDQDKSQPPEDEEELPERGRSREKKRNTKRRSSLEKLHDALKEMRFDTMLPLGPRRCTRAPEEAEPAATTTTTEAAGSPATQLEGVSAQSQTDDKDKDQDDKEKSAQPTRKRGRPPKDTTPKKKTASKASAAAAAAAAATTEEMADEESNETENAEEVTAEKTTPKRAPKRKLKPTKTNPRKRVKKGGPITRAQAAMKNTKVNKFADKPKEKDGDKDGDKSGVTTRNKNKQVNNPVLRRLTRNRVGMGDTVVNKNLCKIKVETDFSAANIKSEPKESDPFLGSTGPIDVHHDQDHLADQLANIINENLVDNDVLGDPAEDNMDFNLDVFNSLDGDDGMGEVCVKNELELTMEEQAAATDMPFESICDPAPSSNDAHEDIIASSPSLIVDLSASNSPDNGSGSRSPDTNGSNRLYMDPNWNPPSAPPPPPPGMGLGPNSPPCSTPPPVSPIPSPANEVDGYPSTDSEYDIMMERIKAERMAKEEEERKKKEEEERKKLEEGKTEEERQKEAEERKLEEERKKEEDKNKEKGCEEDKKDESSDECELLDNKFGSKTPDQTPNTNSNWSSKTRSSSPRKQMRERRSRNSEPLFHETKPLALLPCSGPVVVKTEVGTNTVKQEPDMIDLEEHRRDVCSTKCEKCHFSGKKIVAHYVNKHYPCNIPQARLMPETFNGLIELNISESPQLLEINLDLTQTPIWPCLYCDDRFDCIVEFYEHLTSHTGEFRYECGECGISYPFYRSLINHLKSHKGVSKNAIRFSFDSTIEKSTRELSGFLCNDCFYFQLRFESIIRHIEVTGHSSVDVRSVRLIRPLTLSLGTMPSFVADASGEIKDGTIVNLSENSVVVKNEPDVLSIQMPIIPREDVDKRVFYGTNPDYRPPEIHTGKKSSISLASALDEAFLENLLKKAAIVNQEIECSDKKRKRSRSKSPPGEKSGKGKIRVKIRRTVSKTKPRLDWEEEENDTESEESLEEPNNFFVSASEEESEESSGWSSDDEDDEVQVIQQAPLPVSVDDYLDRAGLSDFKEIQLKPGMKKNNEDQIKTREAPEKEKWEDKYFKKHDLVAIKRVGDQYAPNVMLYGYIKPSNPNENPQKLRDQKELEKLCTTYGHRLLPVKCTPKYQDMITKEKLLHLFKCMSTVCNYTTDRPAEFLQHLKQYHYTNLLLTSQQSCSRFLPVRDVVMMKDADCCPYCAARYREARDLVEHIVNQHAQSPFQCNRCFYRAFYHRYVVRHFEVEHPGEKMEVLKCPRLVENSVEESTLFQIFVYKCDFSDTCDKRKRYVFREDFVDHLRDLHPNAPKYPCHLCKTWHPLDDIIEHYKSHNLYRFHCSYCSFGSEIKADLDEHFVFVHPNTSGRVFYRVKTLEGPKPAAKKKNRTPSDDDNSCDAPGDGSDDEHEKGRVTNLKGKELYRCVTGDCDFAAINNDTFKEHINSCSLVAESRSLACAHCERKMKTSTNLLEHMKVHGEKKQICSLCNFKYYTTAEITKHIKAQHRVTTHKMMKKEFNNGDPDPDIILCPKDVTAKSMYTADSFRNNYYHLAKKAVFSSENIHLLPQNKVFSSDLNCALCPYTTKVRSNMVRHLDIHKQANADCQIKVPQIQCVNPVPYLSREGLEFDKMMNLAASSHKAAGSATIAEVKKLPEFVKEQFRYVCSVCDHITSDDTLLQTHIKVIHSEVTMYKCPHCQKNPESRYNPENTVPLDKIAFHLRLHGPKLYKCGHCMVVNTQLRLMEKHIPEKHPEKKPIHYLVRDVDPDGVPSTRTANSAANRRSSADDSKTASAEKWKCFLCSSKAIFTTWDEARGHIESVHRTNNQFMCLFCMFSNNDVDEMIKHSKELCKDPVGVEAKKRLLVMFSKVEAVDGDEGFSAPVWKKSSGPVRHIHGNFTEDSLSLLKQYNSNSQQTNDQPPAGVSSPIRNSSVVPAPPKPVKSATSTGKARRTVTAASPSKSNAVKTTSAATAPIVAPPPALANPIPAQKVEVFKYYCHKCDVYKTKNPHELRIHLCNEFRYKRWLCLLCSTKFTTEKSLKGHIERDHQKIYLPENYEMLPENSEIESEIDECIEKQNRKKDMIHSFAVEKNGKLSCKQCKEDGYTYETFETHILVRHSS